MPQLLRVVDQPASRVLPRSLTLNTLTLLLTFRCNYSCSHCVFRSGPHRTETMDERLGRGAISAARRLVPSLEMVAFSGGEPFLVPELLQALHEHAHAAGLTCAVVTNAFWAKTPEAALQVLEPLCARGLVDLTTSLDEFHLPYAPAERVRFALDAALRLGLRAHLNVAVRAGSDLRAATAHRVLGVPRAALRGVTICEFSPTLVGSAHDQLSPADIIDSDAASVIGGPCPYVLRSLTVTPDGSVHGCCGVGGATDHGPASLLRVGNLHEERFDDLHERMTRNLAFHVIARRGPHFLLEAATRANPSIRTRARFAHICDVCHEITVNDALRGEVRRVLERLAAGRA
jgi:hypothetical protein